MSTSEQEEPKLQSEPKSTATEQGTIDRPTVPRAAQPSYTSVTRQMVEEARSRIDIAVSQFDAAVHEFNEAPRMEATFRQEYEAERKEMADKLKFKTEEESKERKETTAQLIHRVNEGIENFIVTNVYIRILGLKIKQMPVIIRLAREALSAASSENTNTRYFIDLYEQALACVNEETQLRRAAEEKVRELEDRVRELELVNSLDVGELVLENGH